MPQPRISKSEDERGPARRRAPIVIAVAGLAVAAIVAVLLIGIGSEPEGRTIELVIPKGTSARIDSGESVPGIPDRIEASVGDTLLIVNRDSATQFVSGFAISPGQEVNIPLSRPGTYSTNCSAHKDKSIEMVVKS